MIWVRRVRVKILRWKKKCHGCNFLRLQLRRSLLPKRMIRIPHKKPAVRFEFFCADFSREVLRPDPVAWTISSDHDVAGHPPPIQYPQSSRGMGRDVAGHPMKIIFLFCCCRILHDCTIPRQQEKHYIHECCDPKIF